MGNNRLLKQILYQMPQGNKGRRRPRKKLGTGYQKNMREKLLNDDEWNNRRQWRMGIASRKTYKVKNYDAELVVRCPYAWLFNASQGNIAFNEIVFNC